MLIVGEKINGSIDDVRYIIQNKDERALVKLAQLQLEAGANIIDVNVGAGEKESGNLVWAVSTIQSSVNVPLMLDSGNPEVIKAAKFKHCGRPILNSITGEQHKMDSLLPLLSKGDCGVVALCIDDDGFPQSPTETLNVAEKIVNTLENGGVGREDIYLDPMIMSLGTESQAGMIAMESIRLISENIPNVHIIAAISNISFGLPSRRLINRAFLISTMVAGLDSFILDVTDRALMASLWAANLISGKDEGCRAFLQAYRHGSLE